MYCLIFAAIILISSVFSTASSANSAGQLLLNGSLQPSSASYYSGMDGTFSVSYTNESIPLDSTVYLRHGFQRSEFQAGELHVTSNWNDISVIEMKRVGTSEWRFAVTKQLYGRGTSWQFTALDFVLEIRHANGPTDFDRGSESKWGYFESKAPEFAAPCNQSPDACVLPIKVIVKN